MASIISELFSYAATFVALALLCFPFYHIFPILSYLDYRSLVIISLLLMAADIKRKGEKQIEMNKNEAIRQVREIDEELKIEVELKEDIERTLRIKYEALLTTEKEKNIALETRIDTITTKLSWALRKAENAFHDELTNRKEVEKELERKNLETGALKTKHDDIVEKMETTNKKKIELELHIIGSDKVVKGLGEELLKARDLSNTLKLKLKEVSKKFGGAVKEAKELHQKLSKAQGLSYIIKLELKEMSKKFDDAVKEAKELNQKLLESRDLPTILKLDLNDAVEEANKLRQKLLEASDLPKVLKLELRELSKKHDDAVEEGKELCEGLQSFAEYEKSEIEKATKHVIGRGGYGTVYKGELLNVVAIKKLNPETTQGQRQFRQEVSVLCKVIHPNIVTLVGACPEICALIYEYLPNGSLADRLSRKEGRESLDWRTRIHIIMGICSALICLHSTEPHPVVHGDLKPGNILLDSNLKSKLGDFGISRLLSQSSLFGYFCHETNNPIGTPHYVDPEFLRTKQLKTSSDVYSFGVVVLVLLTGISVWDIAKVVKDAIEGSLLPTILDKTAGTWRLEHAEKLVNFALECCDLNPVNRPVLSRKDLHEMKAMLTADSVPVVV